MRFAKRLTSFALLACGLLSRVAVAKENNLGLRTIVGVVEDIRLHGIVRQTGKEIIGGVPYIAIRSSDPSDHGESYQFRCDGLFCLGAGVAARYKDQSGINVADVSGIAVRVAGDLVVHEGKPSWDEIKGFILSLPEALDDKSRLDNDSSVIHIYRSGGLKGSAWHPVVFMNKTAIVAIPQGAYFEVRLPFGDQEFSVEGSSSPNPGLIPLQPHAASIAVNVKKKIPAYARLEFRGFAKSARWEIVETTPEEAERDILKGIYPLQPGGILKPAIVRTELLAWKGKLLIRP